MSSRAPTGIAGLDSLTGGGLPRGHTTLIVGGPGSGKTISALQSLAVAARTWNEPGVFVAFEERPGRIIAHASVFGWEIAALQKKKKLFFLDARLAPSVAQDGPFDLSGMLAALTVKTRDMRATRVVFDGLDALLDMLNDPAAERREAYRLRDWLDESGLTGIVTAKADGPENGLSARYSHLQYMADCVISLQHVLSGHTAVRAMRVLKYRGVRHSADATPLLISDTGVEVGAVERDEMSQRLSNRRVSTGVARLDTMLSGGYHQGSSILISGAPGTAKSTLAAAFAAAAARRERTLYVSFDEPAVQILRNMRSVGIDLALAQRAGRLRIMSFLARGASAEEQYLRLRSRLAEGGYRSLVIDPITALASAGGQELATDALLRLLYAAKQAGVTVLMTAMVDGPAALSEATSTAISTIADTWIQLSYVVRGGERNRALTIIKSRGTAHSNQVRELVLSKRGLSLADVYTAGGEVLMGTLRWEKEQEDVWRRERGMRETAVRERELELDLLRAQAALERYRVEARTGATRESGHAAALGRRRRSDAGKTAGRRDAE